MRSIPYGRQSIDDDDIRAVVEVLGSDLLTQGPQVPRFEQAVAAVAGAVHGVAVNSATSALHLACLALGLGPGDWLWTSPITFVASANCGLYCGARIDFVDIDPRTYNLCPEALARKLEWAEREGCVPKVVVPVHMAGQPCDMRAIHRLSQRYGFHVLEDASHAIGGRYLDEAIGACSYSDITVFSFHPVKIVTTAEGGIAMTNDPVLAERMRLLRSHGITRDAERMVGASDGPWYYQQLELGFNYRMNELQAALGIAQLRRLEDFIMRRRELAQRYDTCLQGLPLTLPWQHGEGRSSWHLYVIRLRLELIGEKSHRQVYEALRGRGIGVNVHYIPVHTQPFYRRFGFSIGDFPLAEAYYQEALSLPLFPGLTASEQDYVCAALQEVLLS